ncbi:hypothetical protein ACSZNP_18460 [Aeromonas hydrophila]
MFLLSVGEAVLFPLFNVLIDEMAPAHLKGSYFGASALAGLGWALSPWWGAGCCRCGVARPCSP